LTDTQAQSATTQRILAARFLIREKKKADLRGPLLFLSAFA